MRAPGVMPLLTLLFACGGRGGGSGPVSAPAAIAVVVAPVAPQLAASAPAAPAAPAAPGPGAPAPIPAVPTLVASPGAPIASRIESFYPSRLPVECDVDIERFARLQQGRTTARMHLVFVRAGRFHATLSTGEVLIVDSGLETIVEPQTRQVHQRTVARDHCPMALAQLAGPGALTQHLSSLEAYPGASMNAQGLDVLVGTPSTTAAVTKALYYADPRGEVMRTLFASAAGRERFDLRCTPNVTPPPSLFQPPPPPTRPTTAHALPAPLTTHLP